MRNRAFAVVVLILFIAAAFTPAAFAAQALLEQSSDGSPTAWADETADTELEGRDSPGASLPALSDEVEAEETSGDPSPDPGASADQTAASVLSLEVAGPSVIYLNEETPAIRVKWSGPVPEQVAGYIWSVAKEGAAPYIFNISYDNRLSQLPAGALNGHVAATGRYTVQCQAVTASQTQVGSPAEAVLRVAPSSHQLTITANRSFPVAVGSSVDLTPDIGGSSDQVVRYEWKPAVSASGSKVCHIASVMDGAIKYTCTAVLASGERITGTIIVTGTELMGAPHSITLKDGDADESLTVAWTNGAPASDLTYRWNVPGYKSADLTAYTGTRLPASALQELPVRDNPYTVTCQAVRKGTTLGRAVTFHVAVKGQPHAGAMRIVESRDTWGPGPTSPGTRSPSAAQASADPDASRQLTGPVPDTDDPAPDSLAVCAGVLMFGSACLAACALRPRTHSH